VPRATLGLRAPLERGRGRAVRGAPLRRQGALLDGGADERMTEADVPLVDP
jgi:hypothetical protein